MLGVYEAISSPIRDNRGSFVRLFCANDLADTHGARSIVQVNQSVTHTVGAIRGLHFQYPPYAEAKWVRCLRGRVFDVAVDLRHGSKTFLHWHGVELSPEKANVLFIPEGCAHGFQILEPDSELLYLHTAAYAPEHEGGARWDDPQISITWPLPVTDLSGRDQNHPQLDKTFEGLRL